MMKEGWTNVFHKELAALYPQCPVKFERHRIGSRRFLLTIAKCKIDGKCGVHVGLFNRERV